MSVTVHSTEAVILYTVTLLLGVITCILGSIYIYVWLRYYRREPGYLWKRHGNVVMAPQVCSRAQSLLDEVPDVDGTPETAP